MSIRDGGIFAPHGPNQNTNRHVATTDIPDRPDMTEKEASVINSFIYPTDSYTENGTYWADLPLGKRVKFINSVNNAEAKREFISVWRMFKNDPLAPFGYYLKNMVLPGAGLLLEGYVLFSIGNVKPLLQAAFPECWSSATICDEGWIRAVEYLEILGIIFGQVLVGIIGDWLGRRWGLIQDATIMFVGLLMLTAAWGVTQNGWVICYAWSLFFYGVGVGGEYPMTATSGMENAVGSGKISTADDRLHRGRKVTSAFLMQGWGQFLNQVILILLLLIFNSGSGNPPYSTVVAQWTYRVSFAIPAVGTLWLVYYRTFKMKSAGKQLAAAKKKSNVTGYDTQSLKLTFTYFGSRILATAGSWALADLFFYGNKLFQNEFIKVLTPGNKSVMVGWLYNLINIGVSLIGYYLASFLIDNKLYGRKKMMIVGFMAQFILLVIPAFAYNYFTSPEGVTGFQTVYFLSSFFTQFGANSVTFLVAAESYPTPVRATAHGFSAAVGKCGALLAAVLYNYIDTPAKFLFQPWFGLAGAFLTFVFLPDTTGLDLKEGERRWKFIREGRGADYHGIAIHPKHLSLWERWRGISKNYNPELDYQQKVEEFRGEWLQREEAKHAIEREGKHEDHEHVLEGEWSDELDGYFSRTTSNATPYMGAQEKKISEEKLDLDEKSSGRKDL